MVKIRSFFAENDIRGNRVHLALHTSEKSILGVSQVISLPLGRTSECRVSGVTLEKGEKILSIASVVSAQFQCPVGGGLRTKKARSIKASPPMGCGASSEGGGGGSSAGDAAAAAAAAEVVKGEENKVQNFFTFPNSGF